jgi:hypothetical protein
MEWLAVFHVCVLVEIVVKLICLVYVLGVDLISLLPDTYKRVIDFLGWFMNMPYF